MPTKPKRFTTTSTPENEVTTLVFDNPTATTSQKPTEVKPTTLPPAPSVYKITYGGWYQRTTLHLSEIYEFLAHENSYLNLDKTKLKKLHQALDIASVTRKVGYLEYVEVITKNGMRIVYYEDGLYLLSTEAPEIEKTKKELENYYYEKLNPAINYLFSLGAPTPKILANIQTKHPTVILNIAENQTTPQWMEHVYNKIEAHDVTVYKSQDYIYITAKPNAAQGLDEIIDMQVFFREFKDQLEKYLNIHRKIWEEIAQIKESNAVKTKDLGTLRAKLDSYQKTINLITNRINQMGSYARTRKSLAQQIGIDQKLVTLFQYRFEVLLDTLEYIKEIWKMTTDYVNTAIQVLVEAQNAANAKNIQSLTLITSIGVLSGLVGYLSRDTYPKVTLIGASYLAGLLVIGWIVNKIVTRITANKIQRLRFTDTEKKL